MMPLHSGKGKPDIDIWQANRELPNTIVATKSFSKATHKQRERKRKTNTVDESHGYVNEHRLAITDDISQGTCR